MNNYSSNKDGISKIIESIIELIKNPKLKVEDCAYFYRPKDKNNFLINLYLFKLILNNQDYLEEKYEQLRNKFNDSKQYKIENNSNS